MKKLYSPSYIEKIAQKYWEDNKTFSVIEDKNKEKYYCLSMLPYPSGKLHMGHVRNYTIGDVISRYQRMLGKNVLQPIGWDAFGLPAEQAAILNKINPSEWTFSNICYMKKQLKSLGFAYDWDREIITCHPKYYKWEQWFFIVLYNKGLVYKKTTLVNWCPYHKTVLANEQVIDNCCWRCNLPVQYKKIPQWFIKITNYSNELLDNLNQLKYWPEQVKTMQRNWIGKTKGFNVVFKMMNSDSMITIYITRLDVFMGITYISISIDHPIALKKAKTDLELHQFIKKYNKFFIESYKQDHSYHKKKGFFTQMYVQHPITNAKLPIWVTNFLIPIEYDGVGAVASCPAHNQQDWEFAHQYNLAIIPVIKHIDGRLPNIKNQAMLESGLLFNSSTFNGLTSHVASNIISKILIKKKIGQLKISYQLKDWGVSRQRYWGVPIPMITLKDGSIKPVPISELPVILPEKVHINNNDINNTLKKNLNWIRTTYKNQNAFRDTDTFDTFMESSWYYARYTCPHYDHGMLDYDAANYWLPIDQYIGGIEHAIMHLMYFRFYHKLLRDIGLVNTNEPATRLLCQGMILSDSFYYLSNNGQKVWVSSTDTIITRNTAGNITNAVDIHGNNLIYAGMHKMSKSKNNGVDPNIIVQKYGADAVRFFIMFASPVCSSLEWKESGIEGAQRFLRRLWNIVYQHIQNGPVNNIDFCKLNNNHKMIRYYVHQAIIKVTDDIDRRQSFNTALATIMKLVNNLKNASKTSVQDRSVLQEALLIVVKLLYPFTPHICFTLWKALGGAKNIDDSLWPVADTKSIHDEKILIIIQINGKKRKIIFVSKDSNKDVIIKIAKKEILLDKKMIDKKIYKMIYVPNKVINFLIE